MKASRCWCALLFAALLCSGSAVPRAQESKKEKPATEPVAVRLGALVLDPALDDIYIQGGATAINDAVYLAAERLARLKQQEKMARRYSLVLVTDGEDRAS